MIKRFAFFTKSGQECISANCLIPRQFDTSMWSLRNSQHATFRSLSCKIPAAGRRSWTFSVVTSISPVYANSISNSIAWGSMFLSSISSWELSLIPQVNIALRYGLQLASTTRWAENTYWFILNLTSNSCSSFLSWFMTENELSQCSFIWNILEDLIWLSWGRLETSCWLLAMTTEEERLDKEVGLNRTSGGCDDTGYPKFFRVRGTVYRVFSSVFLLVKALLEGFSFLGEVVNAPLIFCPENKFDIRNTSISVNRVRFCKLVSSVASVWWFLKVPRELHKRGVRCHLQ